MAYETTTVTIADSQAGIRKLLRKHGAESFTFREGKGVDGGEWAGVEFIFNSLLVRIQVPHKIDEKEIREKVGRAWKKTAAQVRAEYIDQEGRRIWRVLHWSIKARLEAVEEGVETFEQAFLAHLVDPATGATLWQFFRQSIEDGRLKIDGPGLALPEKAGR